MADDIVTRLRQWQAEHDGTAISIYEQAADEIERLREQVARLEQLGDDLERVAFHETQGQCIGHRAWKPVKAWREARRG